MSGCGIVGSSNISQHTLLGIFGFRNMCCLNGLEHKSKSTGVAFCCARFQHLNQNNYGRFEIKSLTMPSFVACSHQYLLLAPLQSKIHQNTAETVEKAVSCCTCKAPGSYTKLTVNGFTVWPLMDPPSRPAAVLTHVDTHLPPLSSLKLPASSAICILTSFSGAQFIDLGVYMNHLGIYLATMRQWFKVVFLVLVVLGSLFNLCLHHH